MQSSGSAECSSRPTRRFAVPPETSRLRFRRPSSGENSSGNGQEPVSASGVPRNGGNTPSLLQALLQDQDLLLILALLILLRAEKADLPLLLAVGYLLL